MYIEEIVKCSQVRYKGPEDIPIKIKEDIQCL